MEAQASQPGSSLVIQASPAWRTIDVAEIWRYRELLYFLVWRDVKVRYKQTTLGIAWAVIQPLFAMLIFVAIFGRVARLPSDGVPYSLFAYAGLLPWTFFSNATNAGSASLFGSAQLVTKVYFPRILIPVSAVSTALVDFALASVMLVPLLLLERVAPSPEAVIGIPMAIGVCLLVTFGLAIWGSALVVRYWDLRHVIPFVMQIWLFATPVIYPLSMVPARWRWAVTLNPMAPVVETFRGSIFGRPLDMGSLAYAAFAGIVLIATGSVYFRHMERTFADTI
jgi:lipopolysaccharide transport system permease protein